MPDAIGSVAEFLSVAIITSQLGSAELLLGVLVGCGLLAFPIAELRDRAAHVSLHRASNRHPSPHL